MSTRAEMTRAVYATLMAKDRSVANYWLGFPIYITEVAPPDCIVIADEYGNVYNTIPVSPQP